MDASEAERLLRTVTEAWVRDEESDVVWAGEFEGRWGLRMAQSARDFTTVWFDVGGITVHFEAYLVPAPAQNREAVYRYCLARNRTSWPATITADARGELYVAGRIPLDVLTPETVDAAVGAVHTVVDTSFPTLVRLGFQSREKSR
jgi:hypothetical protein